MYGPFFKESIFAYTIYYTLVPILVYAFYKKIDIFKSKYVYKFSTLVKIIVLVGTVLFNITVYTILYLADVVWIIGVVYNALSMALTLYLMGALFFKKEE